MSNPLVSIVIPVYNVDKYLDECIMSAVNQSYPNVEVIAINDGSIDRSLEILKKYEKTFQNVKVISQKNKGQSVARNVGIMKSQGKYIYFLDSDDYIQIDTLKNLIFNMEKNNLDLIRFAAKSFSDGKSSNYKFKNYSFKKHFEKNRIYNQNEFSQINLKTFTPSPVLYVVKKSILLTNKIRFKPSIIHEDELFTLEVFLNVDRVMYDSNSYYNRRYRPGSTMTTMSKEHVYKSFSSRVIVLKELAKLLDKQTQKNKKKLIIKRIRINERAVILNRNISLSERREAISQVHKWNWISFHINYLKHIIYAILISLKKRISSWWLKRW